MDAADAPHPACPTCGSEWVRYRKDLNGYPVPVDADEFVFECRNGLCPSVETGEALFTVERDAVLAMDELLSENDYVALLVAPLVGGGATVVLGVILAQVIALSLFLLFTLVVGFSAISLGALVLFTMQVEADTAVGRGLRRLREGVRSYQRTRAAVQRRLQLR
jgi:hypothetical protein